MIICGIDPGLKGAISFIDSDSSQIYGLHKLPVEKQKNGKNRLNLIHLADLIKMYGPKFACLEKVGAMPGQGVTSMFNFGVTYGGIMGVLAAQKVYMHEVVPAVWKIQMGLSRDKTASIKKVQEFFPSAPEKLTHDEAESLLLARFGVKCMNALINLKNEKPGNAAHSK